MDNERDILRGQQAKELLEHPLLAEAFTTLEQEILSEWQNSPARDIEGREKLWMMLKLAQRVKSALETLVDTGKLAKHQLIERQSLLPNIFRG